MYVIHIAYVMGFCFIVVGFFVLFCFVFFVFVFCFLFFPPFKEKNNKSTAHNTETKYLFIYF